MHSRCASYRSQAARDGTHDAAALGMAILDSIDPALLATVTGAGLSLGDRNPPPQNPNPWSGSIDRAATAMSNGYKGAIDPGMVRMPENPKMDTGIWGGMDVPSGGGGGGGGGGLDI